MVFIMKRLFLLILFCCLPALLIYPGYSVARQTYGDIHKSIVSFSPTVQTTGEHHSCQGVRVSTNTIFTTGECTREVSHLIGSGTPVEVHTSTGFPLGHIRLPSPKKSMLGILGVDSHGAPVETDPHYSSLHDKPLAGIWLAQAFFVPAAGSIVQTVPVMMFYHKSDHNHHYTFNTHQPLPPGAPVAHQGKVICTVSPDGTCRAPVIKENSPDRKQDCHERLPGIYYYPGCMNRTITSCSEDLWDLQGKGTCINSMSGEACYFSTGEEYDSETIIYNESITCPSCNASFFEDIYKGDPPVIDNTCTPQMCMKGCDSDSRSEAIQDLIDAMALSKSARTEQESCAQCMAQEQQMFNNCQQICEAGFSYQACKDCSEAVTRQEAYCQSICKTQVHPEQ